MKDIRIFLITSREEKSVCEVQIQPLKEDDYKGKEIISWINGLNNESGLSIVSTYENKDKDIKKLIREVEKEALQKIKEATLVLSNISSYRIEN